VVGGTLGPIGRAFYILFLIWTGLGHYRPRNSFLRHDGHGLRCRAPPIPIGPVGPQTLPENPDDAATIPRGANGIFRSVGPMGRRVVETGSDGDASTSGPAKIQPKATTRKE
jgi:hypothetical protein